MNDDTTFLQRQSAKLPPFWKLKVIRCSIYALVVGADAFDTGVEGFESFSAMTSMQIGKLIMHIVIAMLTVWVAFLDTTMNQTQTLNGTEVKTATTTEVKPTQ